MVKMKGKIELQIFKCLTIDLKLLMTNRMVMGLEFILEREAQAEKIVSPKEDGTADTTRGRILEAILTN
jgi:hypothetical protein